MCRVSLLWKGGDVEFGNDGEGLRGGFSGCLLELGMVMLC